MEINEKTKISFGFLVVILGGLGSFIVLFASTASKEYVKEKVGTLEAQLDDMAERLITIDNRLYEIQKDLASGHKK